MDALALGIALTISLGLSVWALRRLEPHSVAGWLVASGVLALALLSSIRGAETWRRGGAAMVPVTALLAYAIGSVAAWRIDGRGKAGRAAVLVAEVALIVGAYRFNVAASEARVIAAAPTAHAWVGSLASWVDPPPEEVERHLLSDGRIPLDMSCLGCLIVASGLALPRPKGRSPTP